MHVSVPREQAEIAHDLVRGVEQAQLHVLVGHDVIDHLYPDVLEWRTAWKNLSSTPVDERLGPHRPFVIDGKLPKDVGDHRKRRCGVMRSTMELGNATY